MVFAVGDISDVLGMEQKAFEKRSEALEAFWCGNNVPFRLILAKLIDSGFGVDIPKRIQVCEICR